MVLSIVEARRQVDSGNPGCLVHDLAA